MSIREMLTEDDMKRLSKSGIDKLIDIIEKRLSVWSLATSDRKKLERDLTDLKELRNKC